MGMTDGKRMDMEDALTAQKETFYYHAWCVDLGQSRIGAWKISQRGCINMEHAARIFAETVTEYPSIITVQDWRGRISKFEITIELRPHYLARRIQ